MFWAMIVSACPERVPAGDLVGAGRVEEVAREGAQLGAVEIALVVGTAQHGSFRSEFKARFGNFLDHELLIYAVQSFGIRVAAPFSRRMVDHSVDAALL